MAERIVLLHLLEIVVTYAAPVLSYVPVTMSRWTYRNLSCYKKTTRGLIDSILRTKVIIVAFCVSG